MRVCVGVWIGMCASVRARGCGGGMVVRVCVCLCVRVFAGLRCLGSVSKPRIPGGILRAASD